MNPDQLQFAKTHEWVRLEKESPGQRVATVGISQFAVEALTDLVYMQLPEVGRRVTAGESFGEIESVKATSDLYTGVSGTVSAVNAELAATPGLVNSDPYDSGWMLKIKPQSESEFDQLLSSGDYLKKTGH